MRRLDLNLLASLDALLQERNVTVAAERLGVAQPTMSGMLNRLREQLKDPLLVRVGNSYELTTRALEIKERVHQTLLQLDELVRPSDDFSVGKAVRHLRVMASEYTTMLLLPSVVQRAAQEAPGLSFEILPIEDPAARVFHGDVDICISGILISYLEGSIAALIRAQTIFSETYVGLVDPEHPISDTPSIEEVLTYPRIATQFPGIGRTVEDIAIPRIAAERSATHYVSSFIAIAPLVLGSRFIGIVPRRMTRLLAPVWKLRWISLPPPVESTAVRLLWHLRHDEDPLHRWVRLRLAEAAAALAAEESR